MQEYSRRPLQASLGGLRRRYEYHRPEYHGRHLSRIPVGGHENTLVGVEYLGHIWLVTFSSVNLLSFDEQGHISKVCAYRYHGNTPDVSIRDVEGNGKPWIGIDGGLFRLVEKNGQLVREEISPLFRSLNGLYITDMLKRGSVFWISTNHGLFRYDPYHHRLDSYLIPMSKDLSLMSSSPVLP